MTDYEKLKAIIDEIEKLITEQETYDTSNFKAWYSKAGRFLAKKYGEKSREMIDFKSINFEPMLFGYGEEVMVCRKGLKNAKAILSTYLEDLEELKEENDEKQVVKKVTQTKNLSKIFIVHGHDEALKQEVARLIEKQDIEAIILSEKANKGKTIIEKLEENSDVGCAICLFTPDDMGKANKETDYKARARQNVVLEAGFFMGKLGREHVVYLAQEGLEMPSDLQGVVYANATNWQVSLLKELKEMGYKVDFNKLFQ